MNGPLKMVSIDFKLRKHTTFFNENDTVDERNNKLNRLIKWLENLRKVSDK